MVKVSLHQPDTSKLFGTTKTQESQATPRKAIHAESLESTFATVKLGVRPFGGIASFGARRQVRESQPQSSGKLQGFRRLPSHLIIARTVTLSITEDDAGARLGAAAAGSENPKAMASAAVRMTLPEHMKPRIALPDLVPRPWVPGSAAATADPIGSDRHFLLDGIA